MTRANGEIVFKSPDERLDRDPFGFIGGLDCGNGIWKLGARFYDSNKGSFIQQDRYMGDPGDPLSLNRYVYCGLDPVNFVDPTGFDKQSIFDLNYGKLAVSLGNAANSARLYNGGLMKLATAAGLLETGVGAPGSLVLTAWGAWNLKSASTAQQRGTQQLTEAFNETSSDANTKNLLGLLPYGQEYDDPSEPSFLEFWKGKIEEFTAKPQEIINEVGTLF